MTCWSSKDTSIHARSSWCSQSHNLVPASAAAPVPAATALGRSPPAAAAAAPAAPASLRLSSAASAASAAAALLVPAIGELLELVAALPLVRRPVAHLLLLPPIVLRVPLVAPGSLRPRFPAHKTNAYKSAGAPTTLSAFPAK